MVHHPDFILQSEHLKPNHFYNKENGCIYWAIQRLFESGIDKIDAFNIDSMLNTNEAVKKKIEKFNVKDMQEFLDLSASVARGTIEEYNMLVETVLSYAFKRDLRNKLTGLVNECYAPNVSLETLSNDAYKSLSDVTEKFMASTSVEMFGEKIDELWSDIEVRRTDDGLFGLPSKFPSLNNYFTYETTELVLLKARMKMGKSAFMMNEAIHKMGMGVPTVYFDTEMSDRLFFERMLANISGVDLKAIKNGKYGAEDAKKISAAKEWIRSKPFVHIYNPQFSNEEIYTTCSKLKYKMDLQFVIFDYMKGNTTDSSALYNELGGRCDFLKNDVAGKLKLAVLAACQLNRANQVADSDKLERYASVSMLWRSKSNDEIIMDGEECGNFLLNVSLNRLGEQMMDKEYIDFIFDGSHMQINECKMQHSVQESPF
ncbi:hypothetical protein RASY3_14815 [Ruminococcus albus SY3]|uniref:SF4 helicase domain-containing protein n=1 Tax=Ruminococcus albus SY3 TaxID=1341156 RepID=A0A011VTL1_RUMAL|nr:hypothetical protein RASY3_14815 [Ruminococcus albus SY3]